MFIPNISQYDWYGIAGTSLKNSSHCSGKAERVKRAFLWLPVVACPDLLLTVTRMAFSDPAALMPNVIGDEISGVLAKAWN